MCGLSRLDFLAGGKRKCLVSFSCLARFKKLLSISSKASQ